MNLQVRRLDALDRVRWVELWEGYQSFYEVDLRGRVTDATWSRLMQADGPIRGLVVVKDARVVGIAHYVMHASSWAVDFVCYLQDIFVDPDHRRSGAGSALMARVCDLARDQGAGKVYWITHHRNQVARALYDGVGVHDGDIMYHKSL